MGRRRYFFDCFPWPSPDLQKCRVEPQPVWAAILFDTLGSLSYADEHTSARAAAAYVKRITN